MLSTVLGFPEGISHRFIPATEATGFSHCFESNEINPFQDGGRYHIETSPLICSANQWTGFYMTTGSVLKGLKPLDVLFDLIWLLEKERSEKQSISKIKYRATRKLEIGNLLHFFSFSGFVVSQIGNEIKDGNVRFSMKSKRQYSKIAFSVKIT